MGWGWGSRGCRRDPALREIILPDVDTTETFRTYLLSTYFNKTKTDIHKWSTSSINFRTHSIRGKNNTVGKNFCWDTEDATKESLPGGRKLVEESRAKATDICDTDAYYTFVEAFNPDSSLKR